MSILDGKWIVRDLNAAEMLGYIPTFIDPHDPRPAKEQFNERYAHGGGWNPFKGFDLEQSENKFRLVYHTACGGDEEIYRPLAICFLRDEVITVFEHAWVVIMQKDGSWECARMD